MEDVKNLQSSSRKEQVEDLPLLLSLATLLEGNLRALFIFGLIVVQLLLPICSNLWRDDCVIDKHISFDVLP